MVKLQKHGENKCANKMNNKINKNHDMMRQNMKGKPN